MNESIRKLTNIWANTRYEKDGVIFYSFSETALDQFTKLLAKDCADLCDRFQERNVGMQPAECAGAIRKIFGVENA